MSTGLQANIQTLPHLLIQLQAFQLYNHCGLFDIAFTFQKKKNKESYQMILNFMMTSLYYHYENLIELECNQ